MADTITPENEAFIEQIVEKGSYKDRADALNAAVDLLRSREDLLAKIDEGTRQLRNGEFTVYDDESLKAHFEDVKARGKARYDAHKQQPQSQ